MEDHGCQQEANAFRSAINRPSQATGLSAEMEVKVQP
jgi:hypothetical protein